MTMRLIVKSNSKKRELRYFCQFKSEAAQSIYHTTILSDGQSMLTSRENGRDCVVEQKHIDLNKCIEHAH